MRAVVASLFVAGVAAAAPVAVVEQPASEPAPVAQVTPAPASPPDRASGVAREDEPSLAERLLWIPRAALFVPRAAVWAIGQPIRGAAYAYEQYNLPGRVREVFFDVDGTFGVYPVAAYETGFGVTAGARLVHKDLFGEHERLKLRVDFGGRFRQAYGINLRSGSRLGRVAIEVDSSYERRPIERFYGIGNADAVASQFHEDLVRNVLAADTRLVGQLRARTSAALMLRSFASDQLDPMYLNDVRNVYVEQELVYDSRRPASIYQSRALDGAGWLASAHVGIARGIDGDRSEFVAYGGELQRYFDLYDGSRTLALRALVEAVAGDDDAISFIDLPRLGGSEYLRGYPAGRFRDRVIALGTAEYAWDIGNFLAAYLFVDVGRPFHSFADASASDLRVGYGGGLQVHTGASFLTRLQVAASRDGDVFLQLAFSPSFGRRERAGRF